MDQWQSFIEARLDAHASRRWLLRAKAQKYERHVVGRILSEEDENERDFQRHKQILEAGELEDHIRALPTRLRDVVSAGFLSTRNLRREVETEHGVGTWDGNAAHKGVAVVLGRRPLVCALTSSAIECGQRDRKDPLTLVVLAAIPPLEGTPKLVLKARAALLERVIPERDALVREACAALAARLGIHVTAVEAEEKPERAPRERAPRMRMPKMPSWAREMAEARTA